MKIHGTFFDAKIFEIVFGARNFDILGSFFMLV